MGVCIWSSFFLQEKISALKKQANHIVQQAQREQDHFVKEKNNLIMMLQRVSISFFSAGCNKTQVPAWGKLLPSKQVPFDNE